MKLLFDQNLSPKLVQRISDVFPDSAHVATAGLDRAADDEILAYASRHGYAVVSKDADFADLAQVREEGSKVIWLRLGNCTTQDIQAKIRSQLGPIEALDDDSDARVLELF